MKRILALLAVIMCLAGCMVPMALADSITSVSSDVRLAGFNYGLKTSNPSPSFSFNVFGGIVLFDDITCQSVTVSDVYWERDGSASGCFTVLYTIKLDSVNMEEILGKPIFAIPYDWGDSNVSYVLNLPISLNTRAETRTSRLRIKSLSDVGDEYYVDANKQDMLVFYAPSSIDEMDGADLSTFYVQIDIRDPNCLIVTQSTPKDFVGWITYPFDILLDNLVVLQTVNVFATAPVMSEYLMFGASFLVILIIIKGL